MPLRWTSCSSCARSSRPSNMREILIALGLSTAYLRILGAELDEQGHDAVRQVDLGGNVAFQGKSNLCRKSSSAGSEKSNRVLDPVYQVLRLPRRIEIAIKVIGFIGDGDVPEFGRRSSRWTARVGIRIVFEGRPVAEHIVQDGSRYGEDHARRIEAGIDERLLDHEAVQPAVAVFERMDEHEAEPGDRRSHQAVRSRWRPAFYRYPTRRRATAARPAGGQRRGPGWAPPRCSCRPTKPLSVR